MSIFWYALIPVATPSLRGTSVYTFCRSVLLYEGTEALGMTYEKSIHSVNKKMKEIKKAGYPGSGIQINYLCPWIPHVVHT